jgi:hypothetical protein
MAARPDWRAVLSEKSMIDSNCELTAKDLGAWLGVTAVAVRDAAQRGVLERSQAGCFPLRESIILYCAHLRRLAVGRRPERVRLAKAAAEFQGPKRRGCAASLSRRQMCKLNGPPL